MATTDNLQAETQHEQEHHGLSPAGYMMLLIGLLILTGLTYYTGKFVHLPGSWNLIVALVIATTKATLVCMFFMHLYGDSRINQLLVILAVAFVVLMCSFTILDIQTRFPLAAPPGSLRSRVPTAGSLN
jgi:cytochrome c oxidase subunit 4